MGTYIGLSPALTEIQNNILNTADSISTLASALGFATTSRVISSNDNITNSDYLILADTSLNSIILTLPLISTSLGRKFLIKNIGGHELRINTFSISDKIESTDLFIILSEQYSAINLMASSNNIWYIY